MREKFWFCLAAMMLALAVVWAACGDDDDDDDSNPLAVGGIWGFVRDVDGAPLEGVTATVADGLGTSEQTDDKGVFKVAGASLEGKLVIKFEKEGYTTTFKNLEVFVGILSTVDVAMKKVDKVVTFEADADLDEDIGGGNGVAIAGGSLVDEDGEPVSGEVKAAMTAFDVSDSDQIKSAPGNFTAETSDGSPTMLESFGILDLNFTQDGKKLQLAEGQTAVVEFALPSNANLSEGDIVPLWYFDEDKGRWIEEGSCEVIEDTCLGEVGHFSSWNSDMSYDTSCVRGRMIDESGQGLGGVQVYSEGVDYNGTSQGSSREDGTFTLPMRRASQARMTFTKEDKRQDRDVDTPEQTVDYYYDEEECEDIGDISIDGEFDDHGVLEDLLGFDPTDDPEDIACGMVCG